MMPLACEDQENLVHGHQTAAVLKSLNNGTRGFAPKTPANTGSKTTTNPVPSEKKTRTLNPVFREYAKDDENAQRGGKGTKTDKYVFVTPLAPRDRPPLGAKTTNVQTTSFRTPAPLTQKAQLRSTSTRKAKLKIHRPELEKVDTNLTEAGDEEPQIEYCPPKLKPLPDFPDDVEDCDMQKDFNMFESQNKFRGWFTHLANPIGEDGISKWEREDQERDIRFEKLMDQNLNNCVKNSLSQISPPDRSTGWNQPGRQIRHLTAQPKEVSNMHDYGRNLPISIPSSTLDPRSAVQALSRRPGPRFAEPTTTSTAKKAAHTQLEVTSVPLVTGSIASRTTIGYAQGRKTSSALRRTFGPSARSRESFETKRESVDSDDELLEGVLRNARLGMEHESNGRLSNVPALEDIFLEKAQQEFVLELPEH